MAALIAIFMFLTFVIAGVMNFSFKPDVAGSVYSAQCAAGLSLELKLLLQKHPFDFERGDAIGYGLFYKDGSTETPLYNNGFPSGGMTTPYVGWDYDNGKYSGPARTNDYSPLPVGLDASSIRVFAGPVRVYDRDRPPWNSDNPPFMNIFVDPATMSAATFTNIADCMEKNKSGLDDALQDIQYRLPRHDRSFYFPLTLGGIVRGLPPYADPAYVKTIAAVWGEDLHDKVIPDHGRFTLYPGQVARGLVNGRNIVVSVDRSGAPNLQMLAAATGQAAQAGDAAVSAFGSGGWSIPGPVCSSDLRHCGHAITPWGAAPDRSVTFTVSLRIGANAWAEEPPAAPQPAPP